jgi:hypothetical protein
MTEQKDPQGASSPTAAPQRRIVCRLVGSAINAVAHLWSDRISILTTPCPQPLRRRDNASKTRSG